MPGSDQMIRRRLAGRIWRAGRISCRFRKSAFLPERSVYFVGGDMEKTKPVARIRRATAPMAHRLLQHRKRAHDVGLDEFGGRIDRAIDMAFSGQIYDRVRLIGLEELPDRGGLADTLSLEAIACVFARVFKSRRIRCVGELVDVDDLRSGVAQQTPNRRGSDKARATRYKN